MFWHLMQGHQRQQCWDRVECSLSNYAWISMLTRRCQSKWLINSQVILKFSTWGVKLRSHVQSSCGPDFDSLTLLTWVCSHMDGLVQEKRNSIANALELRLSCTNTSIYMRLAVGKQHLGQIWHVGGQECFRGNVLHKIEQLYSVFWRW